MDDSDSFDTEDPIMGDGDEFTEDEDGGGGGDGDGDDMGPCGMCCCGLIMLPIMLFLLGWNEKKFVCTNKQILYAEKHAKDIGCSANAGTGMFYLSCPVLPSSFQTFTASDFNPGATAGQIPISIKAATAEQKVSMYQCQETKSTRKEKRGDKKVTVTTWEYRMGWSAQALRIENVNKAQQRECSSGLSGGRNPSFPMNLQMGTSSQSVSSLSIGESTQNPYVVPKTIFGSGLTDTPVNLNDYRSKFFGTTPTGAWTAPTSVDTSDLSVDQSGMYLVTCPGQVMIGCIRISYQAAMPKDLSVVSDITSSNTLEPTSTPATWGCSADTFYSFREGKATKKDMLNGHHNSNNTLVWVLRVVGVLGAWLAAYCFFSPITWCAGKVGDCVDYVPCIGDFLEGAINGVAQAIVCTMSLGCGCSCAWFVIGMVWLYMRPLYGAAFLLVTCCCCGLLGYGGFTISQNIKSKKGKKGQDGSESEE